jgi:hypothetical protein
MEDGEGFFAAIPDIVELLQIFFPKEPFHPLHDPGQKRPVKKGSRPWV